MAKKTEIKEREIDPGFALGKDNYIYLLIGFCIIILGFLLMIGGKSANPEVFNGKEIFSFRRITLAPVVVLIGFGFEIWAIMKKTRNSDKV
jgi:hypothetical protein